MRDILEINDQVRRVKEKSSLSSFLKSLPDIGFWYSHHVHTTGPRTGTLRTAGNPAGRELTGLDPRDHLPRALEGCINLGPVRAPIPLFSGPDNQVLRKCSHVVSGTDCFNLISPFYA